MADTWTFTFTGSTITASGTVYVTGTTATSGSASWVNADPVVNVTGNLMTGSGTSPSGQFLYTDQVSFGLIPSIPAYPPNTGILFYDSITAQELNIFYISGSSPAGGPGYYASLWKNGAYVPPDVSGWGQQGTFAVQQVPDGGTTLSLLGLAIVGLAGVRRKLSL
jgi:hypothetical protein